MLFIVKDLHKSTEFNDSDSGFVDSSMSKLNWNYSIKYELGYFE